MGCGICGSKGSQYHTAAISPTSDVTGKTLPAADQGELQKDLGPTSAQGSSLGHPVSSGRRRPELGSSPPSPNSQSSALSQRTKRAGERDLTDGVSGFDRSAPGSSLSSLSSHNHSSVASHGVRHAGEQDKPMLPGLRAAASAIPKPCVATPQVSDLPGVTLLPELDFDEVQISDQKASSPKEMVLAEGEDDEDDEDDEDIEAAMRAAAAALTPRSDRGDHPEPSCQAPAAKKVMASHKCPSQIFDANIDVSMSTRKMLLTWARWGRNAWRSREEDRIKTLQHRRYPKIGPPPRPLPLSPQPTPVGTPRGEGFEGQNAAPTPVKPQLTGAARNHRAGGLGSTASSRDGGARETGGGFFDGLKEEQRDSMDEQGARMKFTQALGAAAAVANSTGTPGFGVETPGFPGAKSGSASGMHSADASVVSSGMASPANGGQLSPWILEAEALVEESDEDASPCGPLAPTAAWGLDPTSDLMLLRLEQELNGPDVKQESIAGNGTAMAFSHLVAEDSVPVEDVDELEKVQMFVESPNKPLEAKEQIESGVRRNTEPEQASQTKRDRVAVQYSVGERVSYYSESHRSWMPARVVERKSGSIYIIDKQNRGCLSKARASELISENEEQKDPVLRAFKAFADFEQPMSTKQRLPSEAAQRHGKGLAHVRPGSGHGNAALQSPGSSTQASTGSRSPPVSAGTSRGKIVRDDFSDDSDDN